MRERGNNNLQTTPSIFKLRPPSRYFRLRFCMSATHSENYGQYL